MHIADFTTPHSGGFIACLSTLGLYGGKEGWRFIFVFPEAAQKNSWAEQLSQNGYKLYFLPSRAPLLNVTNIIREIALKEQANIIHTHFSNYNIPACLASLQLRWAKKAVRVIWHFHSDWRIQLTFLRRIKDFILYNILGRFTYGISVAEHIRENMISRGMQRRRMFYVPNGFDINRIQSRVDSASIRQELGIAADKIVFLTFGWEPITKGVDIVLEAFEILTRQCKNATLLLVGTEMMNNYVEAWEGGEAHEWLVLAAPREQVAEYYKASDVFISASRSEGFPYSVAEAMGANLPIISSDIPGVAWAKQAKGVLLFESGNAIALSQAIQGVLSWPEQELQDRKQSNQQFIVENYTVEKWAKNIIDVYITIQSDDENL